MSLQTVQTHQINIEGGRRRSGRGICQSVITQSKSGRLIVKLPNPSYTPWMLIRWPRLKFARFAQRGWFAPDMFLVISHPQLYHSVQLPLDKIFFFIYPYASEILVKI